MERPEGLRQDQSTHGDLRVHLREAEGSYSGHRLEDYPILVQTLVQVKQANAMALSAAGGLDAVNAQKIIRGCQKIKMGFGLEGLNGDPYSGATGEVISFNVNQILHAAMQENGESILNVFMEAGLAHSAQVALAVRVALLTIGEAFANDANEVIGLLNEYASKFRGESFYKFESLQRAERASVGEYFAGFAQLLQRRLNMLLEAIEYLSWVGVPGEPEFVDEFLVAYNRVSSFPINLRPDAFDARQNIDDLALVGSQLKLLANSIVKVAKDMRLLGSDLVEDLEMRFAQSMNTLPFSMKNRPVLLETLIQSSFIVIGHCETVERSLEHSELSSSAYDCFAGVNLYDALVKYGNAFTVFKKHLTCGPKSR